jgi:hypothetical protein
MKKLRAPSFFSGEACRLEDDLLAVVETVGDRRRNSARRAALCTALFKSIVQRVVGAPVR